MRVPVINSQPLQTAALPRVRVNAPVDTTIVEAGQTAQQIGHGLDVFAQREHDEAFRAQTLEADTSLSRFSNAALYDPQNGALNKQGKNAFDLPNQTLPAFDDEAKRIEEGIPQQRAKAAFRAAAIEKRDQLTNMLNKHESNQREAFNDQTAQDAVSQGVSDMGLYAQDQDAMRDAETKVLTLMRIQGARKGWDTQTTLAKTREAIESGYGLATSALIDAGNFDKAKEFLPYVPDKQRPGFEKSIASAEKETTVNGILGEYEKSTAAGEQALAGITDRDIRQAVNTGLSGIRQEKQRQYAPELVSLARDIASGKVSSNTEDRVFSLYDRGALSVDEMESKIGQITNAREKSIVDNAAETYARDAFAQRMPLDPTDKDAKKGIDKLFTSQNIQPGSMDSAQFGAEIAKRTNVVPESMVSWGRGALLSENPDLAAKAADALTLVQEQAPMAYDFGVDEKTKALALNMSQQTRAGIAPADAFKNIQKLAQQTPEQQERLRELYKSSFSKPGKIAESNTAELQSMLSSDDRYDPTVFGSAPQAPVAMQAEFNQSVERNFMLSGGNIESARKLAFNSVRAKWGYSKINGAPELMPYAPDEKYGITRELINNDLPSFIKKDPFMGTEKTIKPADVKLIATPQTARTQGRKWAVGYENEYGDVEILADDKGQATYALPIDSQSLKRAMDTQALTLKAQAKADRIDIERQLKERIDATGRPGIAGMR